VVEVRLEIPGAAVEPGRDLREHAPGEVLEGLALRVPGREDGGIEELGVAVLVAVERPDVVGGEDADGRAGAIAGSAARIAGAGSSPRARTQPRNDSSSTEADRRGLGQPVAGLLEGRTPADAGGRRPWTSSRAVRGPSGAVIPLPPIASTRRARGPAERGDDPCGRRRRRCPGRRGRRRPPRTRSGPRRGPGRAPRARHRESPGGSALTSDGGSPGTGASGRGRPRSGRSIRASVAERLRERR
jgi:hypothetical protein